MTIGRVSGQMACAAAIAALMYSGFTETVVAQQADEEVVVTGSRIRQDPLNEGSPVLTISSEDIQRSGLTSIGDYLQRLTSAGGALNTRFNSSGNFGFPPDGSGVGAGSSQVDLRHLGAKRTLVLVDGLRWVNESSASGVGGATDLNTIPISIIERIEVLEDGASAIYGADAIAGVVNIITKKDFEGFELSAYGGSTSEGDGNTQEYSLSMGTTTDRSSAFVNLSYMNQNDVSADDVDQAGESAGPGTSNLHGSSGTPQGRFVLTDPNTDGFINCTINDGAAPAPGSSAVFYDPANPCMGDDFNTWSNADRFNFAPFNLVVTPSERWGIFGSAQTALSDNVSAYIRGLYNNRQSTNQAAPEPLFIGSDAGNGNILDTISVDVTNPYNPFGFTVSAEDQAYFMGRRPLEAGPRIFDQDVDTWYFSGGLQGSFDAADRSFFWDVNGYWSQNKAKQRKMGANNARKLKEALGPAFANGDGTFSCGTPDNPILGCVPFNFFGGQGATGDGTITDEMLGWVGFIQQDSSKQELWGLTANISGSIVELPAGSLGFAVGAEHREEDGSFTPDAIVSAGDSAGIPALPTSGGFNTDEFYAELDVPILAEMRGADLLSASLAARYSDFDSFGNETTYKYGLRWRPFADLLFRGSYSEGFRAPSIGELFGSLTRFDATIADPCSDFNNTGVSQDVIDNCISQGVPADGMYQQLGGQISVLTGGNAFLDAETVDTYNFGIVYSPSWVENIGWIDGLSAEFTYYKHELDDAIQAVDAQTTLDACAATNSDSFCDRISRTSSGVINRFENQLTNIGGIDTKGYDINLTYLSPETKVGTFTVSWYNTYLDEFTEELLAPDAPGGFVQRDLKGLEVNDRGKPEWKSTLIVDWFRGDWGASWTLRYVDDLEESCSDFLDGSPDSLTNLGLCSDPNFDDNSLSMNELDSTTFNDLQVTYAPSALDGALDLQLGVTNVFDEDPPDCYSCSLNGYDPSTYDMPGRFFYARATWRRE